ncbi:MAG TPA: hypothetical protein VH268_02830 [Solirubrobacterales bacterium]|nr:hypothetical protein [Solirubrobacterales bacterium]
MYRTGPAAALLLGLSLALASCGSGSSTAASSGITTSPAGGGAVVKSEGGSKPAASKRTPTASKGGGCESRIGEFVSRMDDLRQSLLAGLSYSEYVVRVRAIRGAYEAVPVDKLGLDCLNGAAGAAEDAFNQYLRAANLWGECAGTAGCAASSIEERLQHRWRIASKSLDAAKRS